MIITSLLSLLLLHHCYNYYIIITHYYVGYYYILLQIHYIELLHDYYNIITWLSRHYNIIITS